MKRRFLYGFSTMLCSILFLNGCKKGEPIFTFPKGEQTTCRLLTWHGLDDGYQRNLHYNQNGLMDEWHELAPLFDEVQLFTYEYDHNGRVTLMKFYDHDTLVNNVVPRYSHGRMVGETWFNKNTGAMEDSLVTTYNAQGRVVKRESIPFAYYTTFTYDAYGNNLKTVIKFTDGTLYDSLTQGYDQPIREPMVAVPGMGDYPVNYINYIITPLIYTSLKDVVPDGNGGTATGYEVDPSQSKLVAGPDHFAISYFVFDLVAATGNQQVWEFDNCGCNNKSAADLSIISNSITVKPATASKTHRHLVTTMEMRKQAIRHGLQTQRPAFN